MVWAVADYSGFQAIQPFHLIVSIEDSTYLLFMFVLKYEGHQDICAIDLGYCNNLAQSLFYLCYCCHSFGKKILMQYHFT